MNKDYWTCQIRHWLERISTLKSTKATFIHLYLLNSHHVFVHSSIYHLIHLSSCPFVYPTHYLFSCTSVNLVFLSFLHPSHPFTQLLISESILMALLFSTSATHLMTGRVFSNGSDIVVTGDLHDIHLLYQSLSILSSDSPTWMSFNYIWPICRVLCCY